MKQKLTTIALVLFSLFGAISNGLSQWIPTNGPGSGTGIRYILPMDNKILAAGDGCIFLSTNEGNSWVPKSASLGNIGSIAAGNGSIFMVSLGYLWRSEDDGSSFSFMDSSPTSANLLFYHGSYLFAGTFDNGVWASNNNGLSWQQTNNGLPKGSVYSFTGNNQYIYVGIDSGVYRSSNNGFSWESVSPSNAPATALYTTGQNLFASTRNKIFFSSDNGGSWKQIGSGLPQDFVNTFVAKDTGIFALTQSSGIYYSSDSGRTWNAINNGFTNSYILTIAADSKFLFAGTYSNGSFYRSSNNGKVWDLEILGMANSSMHCLAKKDNILFSGSDNGSIVFTTDNGDHWHSVSSGLGFQMIEAITFKGDTLFVAGDGGVIRSTDDGSSWTSQRNGLPSMIFSSIAIKNEDIFVAGVGGVFHSSDGGASWNSTNSGLTNTQIYSLLIAGDDLFAGTFGSGVFRSIDKGLTWEAANTGIEKTEVYSLTSMGGSIFAGINDGNGGVFRSDDFGVSWVYASSGLTTPYRTDVYAFASTGSNLFAGSDAGMFLSQNQSNNWTAIDEGLPRATIEGLIIMGSNIFAATMGNGVWRRPLSDFGIITVENSTRPDFTISLSPNPTTGLITIHNAPANILHVAVTSILGESVIELAHPNTPEFTLDLSKLPPGTYFARFSLPSEVITRKILKE